MPKTKKNWLLIFSAVAFTVTLTIIVYKFQGTIKQFPEYGLLGIFLLSILNNATLVLPVPTLLIPFFGGALFNPWLVGLVSGAGQALGELTGYWIGYSGQNFVDSKKVYPKIKGWMKKYGMLFIFVFAALPNFLFDFGGIAAGATGMKVWKFLLAAFLGKTLRAFVYALIGSQFPELLTTA